MEAMRCLKRRLSDVVYRQLAADAETHPAHRDQAGPGGHRGATLTSSAADLTPHVGTQREPRPGLDRRHTAPTHPRCQRAAPHRTNDVDTDQRRHTLHPRQTTLLTPMAHRREP